MKAKVKEVKMRGATMVNLKEFSKLFFITAAAALIFVQGPKGAYAWDGDRDWRGGRHEGWHHDHFYRHRNFYSQGYPIGRVFISLPRARLSFYFGRQRYYYCDGVYYIREPHRYVAVAPPPGAIIYSLPDGYTEVVYGGALYYGYEGVYYQRVPLGYQVVAAPPEAAGERGMAAAAAPATVTPESFTVNVPNRKGGYTAVVLKKSGSGYVGPQGEYYNDFPNVEQLKVMYGKS